MVECDTPCLPSFNNNFSTDLFCEMKEGDQIRITATDYNRESKNNYWCELGIEETENQKYYFLKVVGQDLFVFFRSEGRSSDFLHPDNDCLFKYLDALWLAILCEQVFVG